MHGMVLSRIAFLGSTCFYQKRKQQKLLSHNYFKPLTSKKTLNRATSSIDFGLLAIKSFKKLTEI
jgi:hypothetical protein